MGEGDAERRVTVVDRAEQLAGTRVGVDDRRIGDHRRAGSGELDQRDQDQHLGQRQRHGAGGGRRPGRTAGDAGAEDHRHAGGGEDERRVAAVAVDGQRRDREREVADRRSAAQLLGAAGDHGRHLDRQARLRLSLDHRLHVLDGVVPGGVELVQLRRLAAVTGADDRPPVGDRRDVVEHARGVGEVGLGRGAALAGAPVDDLGAAAVGGHVGGAGPEVEVAGAVARAEDEGARRARERAAHELLGEAHDVTTRRRTRRRARERPRPPCLRAP